MSRPLAWVLVVLFFGVFVGAVAYVLRDRADAGKGMPPYSIYSHGARRGAAEAAYVLQQAGWTPVALTRPIQYTKARGLLILVQPEEDDDAHADPTGGVSRQDADALLDWVGEGNTLLVLSRRANGLHQALGLVGNEVPPAKDEYVPVTLDSDLASSDYLRDVHSLSVGSESTLPNQSGALTLWRIGDRPGAMVLPGPLAARLREQNRAQDEKAPPYKKQGRVILVADPSLATYSGLWETAKGQENLRDDNYLFLVNVAAMHARDGDVYFDEYHHGFQSGGGFWGYLRYHGEHLLLLPLFLAAGARLWLWAVRLGPATPTPRTSEADAVDYASALARLYRQAGARRRLARTLARGFLGALTRQLRLRRNALPAEVLSAWRLHDPGPSGDRLQGLLRGVAELRKGDVTEQQLLTWSQGFDQFLKEMETAERGRMGLKAKARRR